MSYPLDVDVDAKTLLQRDPPQRGLSGLIRTVAFLPIQLLLTTVANILLFAQQITPTLIPLVVFFILIPWILFVSLSAGWLVWRSVAVSWEATVYLQYGDGLSPYAEFALPTLVAQQPYDISLHLLVPATESNFALGNFMTTLRLSTASNKTLTVIRRPAIVAPPKVGLWSNVPETIEFDVPLLNSYTAGTTKVLAKIEIGRQDGWRSIGNGEGREITVLASSLQGVIKHHGIRGLVTRFPLLAAINSALLFFGISLIMLALCTLPIMQRRSRAEVPPSFSPVKREEETHRLQESDGDDSSVGQERSWRRRGKARHSRSRSEEGPTVKTEEFVAMLMASTDSGSVADPPPIRRRKSRYYDPELP